MNYLFFLILFIGVPLGALIRQHFISRSLRRLDLIILIILAIAAVIYVTPLINYVVASGIWYYNPALIVQFIIGYVPVETYLFFLMQVLLTALFTLWLWRRFYPDDHDSV